jgi:glucosamine--fructose-6-phosphate aminotransferase (isomerizing)
MFNKVGSELDEGKGVLEAIKAAESKLEGTWGVVLIAKDRPDEICAFKNGSPLLVGISKGRMWVASEPAAFSQYTKEYIALEVFSSTYIYNCNRMEKLL